MRYIVVQEAGSEVEYWVGGSNATRSIASNLIQFEVDDDLLERLTTAARLGQYTPGVMHLADSAGHWIILEQAIQERSEPALKRLLTMLETASEADLVRELALAIRAFAAVSTKRRSLQVRTERALLARLETTHDVETRVALAEDLGYVGTVESLPTLGLLIESRDEGDHVQWAAAVALGRLNEPDATPYLVRGTQSTYTWTRAASLLSLARRAEEVERDLLEPVFVSFLQEGAEPLLQRYSCLGLSKFAALAEPSLLSLVELLADFDVPISVRGYAALAISSVIAAAPNHLRSRIERILVGLTVDIDAEPKEPETVWGLEFMAELATLTELHETAHHYYSELSQLFDDWRGPYYEALGLYEKGEASIGDPSVHEIDLYQEAVRVLDAIDTEEPGARQAIEFRRDVVTGRLALQQAIHDWETTLDPDLLDQLAHHLTEVAQVFARYGHAGMGTAREGVKRLSDREREYLNGTRRLVDVMSTAVRLEASARRGGTPPETYRAHVHTIADVLALLSEQFRNQLARGPRLLAEEAHQSVEDTLHVLEDGGVPPAQQERSVRALTVELRSLFRRSTWPMPARACPIGGLGRGSLLILPEDTPGAGTHSDPFRVPRSVPPVMNVLAEIAEMAPGGATKARVVCEIMGHTRSQPLTAVEGPSRLAFLLPDVFSPISSAVARFSLVFEARDCNQVAAKLDVFIRRDS